LKIISTGPKRDEAIFIDWYKLKLF
jgi:hypothetical protein